MSKIIRVSNSSRGKKLVVSTSNDYVEFISAVLKKFGLEEATKIAFQDDQGAEVDQEVFPVFVEQFVLPNLVFTVVGEAQLQFEVNLNLGNGDFGQQVIYVQPNCNESPKLFRSEESELASFQQVLQALVVGSEQLSEVVSETVDKGSVDDTASSILIKEFVSKLIELKGNAPSTKDQKLFAKAIVCVVPAWKYPDTKDGTDLLYDEINRTGKIQVRLRAIHKNLEKAKGPSTLKRKQRFEGGPKPKRVATDAEHVPDDIQNTIALLNAVSPKDLRQIQDLMTETLPHRNLLRKTNPEDVLRVYRKFAECHTLVNLEFRLLFGEAWSRFLDVWPVAAEKIIEFGNSARGPPALKKFIAEDLVNWDPNIGALFVLLYLIPPTAQGKGKGSRVKVEDAKETLLSFYKTGTPHQSILDTWNPQKSQPNLICLGANTAQLDSFFIVCDRLIIPIDCAGSCAAIDLLFKAHHAFGTNYDTNLVGLWKFIQVFVYKIEVEQTNLPHTAKKVSTQLHGCFV